MEIIKKKVSLPPPPYTLNNEPRDKTFVSSPTHNVAEEIINQSNVASMLNVKGQFLSKHLILCSKNKFVCNP